MARSTITSKGQLTLPKEVREKLGLESGDRVVFEVEGEEVRLRAQKRRSLASLRGSLPARGRYLGREAERAAARRHVAGAVTEKTNEADRKAGGYGQEDGTAS